MNKDDMRALRAQYAYPPGCLEPTRFHTDLLLSAAAQKRFSPWAARPESAHTSRWRCT